MFELIQRMSHFLFVDQWRLTLPLLAGAGAVYYLLPRPNPYPALRGALLGALALLLAGAFLVRTGAVTIEALLFYAFSIIAVVAGTLLVTQHNPARAALSFALVVMSTTGLFLLLAAPFLMAATIIVYAGAIVVTFLFVLMLAQQAGVSDADDRSREPFLSTVTGFVLLGALLYVLQTSYQEDPAVETIDKLLERVAEKKQQLASADADQLKALPEELDGVLAAAIKDQGDRIQTLKQEQKTQEVRAAEGLEHLLERLRSNLWEPITDNLRRLQATGTTEQRAQLLDKLRAGLLWARHQTASSPPPEGQAIPLSNLSGPPANLAPQQVRHDELGRPHLPAENSGYLGRSLFTDYLVAVELGGVLLLVATVGAIAIAQRPRTSV
jgi:NADH:ubiquinone oxidoreductase subunit 6 (subunit J)